MRSKIIILVLCLILTGCNSKTYTITFDTNGGNPIDSIILESGSNLTNIKEPTKEGYLFVGWLKDGIEYDCNKPVKEDMTLTASWIETPDLLNDYTIIFVSHGYEEKVTVQENSTVQEPIAKEKENYNFAGWYLNNEKYDFNTKVTKDMIIVAKYEIKTVTVTYDLDGGMGITSKIIPIGKTIEIPNPPTKEGYKFVKWILNDQPFSFNTPIKEDITIKAVWQQIEYVKVDYNTDGGEVIEPIVIEKYSKINELPTPTKKGYKFKEWKLNDQKFDTDIKIDRDITLTAIYEKESEE